VTGDELSFLQFADRIGLNVFALLTIGFALHAASGVVERDAFKSLRLKLLLVGAALIIFTALRLVILTAQMGDGITMFDPDLLSLAWMVLGPSTLLSGVGAILAIGGVWFESRLGAAAGAVAVSAGFGLTGHSQGLSDPGIAPAAVAAHAAIAGFWIAAPISLYPGRSLDNPKLVARLNRFSSIAVVAIPILIVLGLWLAWILAEGPERLVGTTYGRLLLAKLAVGIAAMGLGAVNKQIVTAKVSADPGTGRRWLRTTLFLESVLFAAAIIAVSAATTIGSPSA
jgi:putative copper export protein